MVGLHMVHVLSLYTIYYLEFNYSRLLALRYLFTLLSHLSPQSLVLSYSATVTGAGFVHNILRPTDRGPPSLINLVALMLTPNGSS